MYILYREKGELITYVYLKKHHSLTVPDRRCRILKVVSVRRLVTWVLGIWRGRDWGRVEKGEVSLQAT
jgi:hypothetical protein